jgi:hypothetical protein
MPKKSSKNPPAKSGNTATVSESTIASPSAPPPAPDSSPAPVSSPAPYKPITDDVSIERLVGLAKDSPPDSALGIVWKHAYEEAHQNGRKEVLRDLRKKLEEKYKEGKKEGMKEGKEGYYGKGIVRGEYDEQERWKAAGHGQHCRAVAACLKHSETQTDPPAIATTSVSTQTSPHVAHTSPLTTPTIQKSHHTTRTPSLATSSTQTDQISTTTSFISTQMDKPDTITTDASNQTDPSVTTIISVQTAAQPAPSTSYSTSGTQTSTLYTWHPTTNVIVQTDSVSTQSNGHINKLPSSSLTPVSAISPASPATVGTESETTRSQNVQTGCPARLATPQSPELLRHRKNSKNSPTSEISSKSTDFSSQTPSLVIPDPQTPATTTPALETRQKPNNFTPKVENFEKSPIITKMTSKIPSSSIIGPTDGVTRVYASPETPDNVIF